MRSDKNRPIPTAVLKAMEMRDQSLDLYVRNMLAVVWAVFKTYEDTTLAYRGFQTRVIRDWLPPDSRRLKQLELIGVSRRVEIEQNRERVKEGLGKIEATLENVRLLQQVTDMYTKGATFPISNEERRNLARLQPALPSLNALAPLLQTLATEAKARNLGFVDVLVDALRGEVKRLKGLPRPAGAEEAPERKYDYNRWRPIAAHVELSIRQARRLAQLSLADPRRLPVVRFGGHPHAMAPDLDGWRERNR